MPRSFQILIDLVCCLTPGYYLNEINKIINQYMFSKSTTNEISPLKIKVNLHKALKQKNLRILFQMLRNYNLNFSLNVLRKLCGYFIIVLYKGFQAINCCLVHQNNYLRRWFGISFPFLFFFLTELLFPIKFESLYLAVMGLMATCRLSLVSQEGATVYLQQAGPTLQLQYTLASHWSAFYCCRAQALGHKGFSSCGSWALKHRLSSWDAQD